MKLDFSDPDWWKKDYSGVSKKQTRKAKQKVAKAKSKAPAKTRKAK